MINSSFCMRMKCARLLHTPNIRLRDNGQRSLFPQIHGMNEGQISPFPSRFILSQHTATTTPKGQISPFPSRFGLLPPIQIQTTRPKGQISLFVTQVRDPYKEEQNATAKTQELSMGVPSSSSASSSSLGRLKREDCRRIQLDSSFSQWKILIGSSDWEKHKMGEEGAERYRTQNLPNLASCPGIYELGILKHGRKSHKLDRNSVLPVYVGQAENVRTRLQQYGRDGAHLENGCSNGWLFNFTTVSSPKKPGLFSDIFSRGFAIVYRFLPMESKKDAENMEKQLLNVFDYAWNKDGNGVRRIEDIHKRLGRHEKVRKLCSLLARKFRLKHKKRVGVEMKTCTLFSEDECSLKNTVDKVPTTFGIKRLQPTRAQYCSDICGVTLGDGSVCTNQPVKGRKRCSEHKWMRVNGYNSNLSAEEKMQRMSHGEVQNQPHIYEPSVDGKFSRICGLILEDGSPCRREPFSRNKRCLDHKGRRILK